MLGCATTGSSTTITLSTPAGPDLGDWCRRRVEEIELFVACVSDDWCRGVVSATEAATAITRYLDRLPTA